MARNIEIKARANDVGQQLAMAKALADGPSTELIQTDTFFHSSKGRLKLREFPNQNAQLIYYHRIDQPGPKLSDYHITRTSDSRELKHTLSETVGVLAVVKKVRTLFMHGRTRIHFDAVENLGDFIELEVVLADGEATLDGEQEAQSLMAALSISTHELIDKAYVDLLLEKSVAV